MSQQFRNYGIIALVLVFVVYYLVNWLTGWDRYLTGSLALSIVTFLYFGWDKLQAKAFQDNARRRIPENLLFLLILLGGWLGGWLGMGLFWHKVRKNSFWVVLIISTVLHLGLMGWWFLG
jgi:uncharacterized membrane protein YsdA (DUF1294 family)